MFKTKTCCLSIVTAYGVCERWFGAGRKHSFLSTAVQQEASPPVSIKGLIGHSVSCVFVAPAHPLCDHMIDLTLFF